MTYTPTTTRVRAAYIRAERDTFIASAGTHGAEFDAWLTEHDRQVAEAAWDEAGRAIYGYGPEAFNKYIAPTNPHRTPQPTEGES